LLTSSFLITQAWGIFLRWWGETAVFHRINSLGKSEGSWRRAFEPGSPQLSGMVFRQLPQAVRHLVAVPLRSFDIKKPLLGRGSFEMETMCGW